MNLWAYLDGRGARRLERAKLKLARERRYWLPSDFAGWLGLGLFSQSTFLFALMLANKDLLDSQGFMTLASAVIVTGWVGGAVAFAFKMGKNAGELALDGKRAEATSNLAQAVTNAIQAQPPTLGDGKAATDAANNVADAAVERAEEISGEGKA